MKLRQQLKSRVEDYNKWKKQQEHKMQSLQKNARKQQIQIGKMQSAMAKQATILERANKKQASLAKKLTFQ